MEDKSKTDGKILELLSLCLEAKKNKIDAFCNYSPHVQTVEMRIFIGGWKRNMEPHFNFYIHIDNENEINEAIGCLKELIDIVYTG